MVLTAGLSRHRHRDQLVKARDSTTISTDTDRNPAGPVNISKQSQENKPTSGTIILS